jgi:hypothetical protein
MSAWAALVLLAQDPWADLDAEAAPTAYRAVERLAAAGPATRAEAERRIASARGRLRSHLQAVLDGPLPPLRRVSLPAGPRSPVELLRELGRQADWPVDDESLRDEALPDVEVRVRDASPFEAVEAICRAAELWPSWDEDHLVLHTGGFVDAPVSRFGPFQVVLSLVRHERSVRFVEPAEDVLLLETTVVSAYGLPLLEVAGIEVIEARDEKGVDLLRPPGPADAPAPPEEEPSDVARPETLQAYPLAVRLRGLSPGARTLARVRGVVRVRLPRATRAVELARPEPGSAGTAPGMSVKVREIRRDESRMLVDLEVSEPALAGRTLLVRGGRERVDARLLESPGPDGLRRLAVAVRPRGADGPFLERLRVEVVEDAVLREVPFEFRGVVLR